MRGQDERTSDMFSYVSPEARVRTDHPLRPIRAMTNRVFARLSPRFTNMYSDIGRPSIPPEQLLRALLIQSLYTIRSERLLMEEIEYSVLYRWFIGLGMDEPVWDPTVFTKNRDRLLKSDVASAFFDAVLDDAREAGLLSDEHFTVDGTMLEAWASLKSFHKKDDPPAPPDDPGNPTVNFHGETRTNDTHQSTTDPDALLCRKSKGREAKLGYLGHVVLDNRCGLIANGCGTPPAPLNARPRCCCLKRSGWTGRSAGTGTLMWRRSSRAPAPWGSPRMSPRRRGIARLTGARRGMRGTRSVNANGN